MVGSWFFWDFICREGLKNKTNIDCLSKRKLRFPHNSIITAGVRALKITATFLEEGMSWQYCHHLYFLGVLNDCERNLTTFASLAVQVFPHHHPFALVHTLLLSFMQSLPWIPSPHLSITGTGTHIPAAFIYLHLLQARAIRLIHTYISRSQHAHTRPHTRTPRHLVFYPGDRMRRRKSLLFRHLRCPSPFEGEKSAKCFLHLAGV